MINTSIIIRNMPNQPSFLELSEEETGLRAAFIERKNIDRIPAEWTENSCGFYILLSRIDEDNTFQAYAGKVMKGFSRMLKEHAETKDFWQTAILFKSDVNNGYGINQAAYLEGKIREILASSNEVEVKNILPPWDHTLSAFELPLMKSTIGFALRLLALRGYMKAEMETTAAGLMDEISAELKIVEVLPAQKQFPLINQFFNNHAPVEIPRTMFKPLEVVGHNTSVVPSLTKAFDALKSWRKQQAMTENVPAYVIASNRTLEDIVKANPVSHDDLLKVPGIGQMKVDRYGDEILKVMASVSSLAA